MYQDNPAIKIIRLAKQLRKDPEHPYIKVLEAYAESYYGPQDFCFQGFAAIVLTTGFPRQRVRFISRLLKRGGWLTYGKGLWSMNDDGPAGAGYALTPIGHALLTLSKEG